MEVINYTILRNSLKVVLDKVSEEQETYIVNLGDTNAVIISLNEYNSWQETLYVLSTDANRKNLEAAIKREKKEKYLTAEEVVEDIPKLRLKNIKLSDDRINTYKGKKIQKTTDKKLQ